MIHTLAIDIETYSSVNLTTTTVYKYADSPDFQILLFGYAIDDEPVQVIDLTTQDLPGEIFDMLTDPLCIKTAYNAQFERVCLSSLLRKRNALNTACYLPPEQWRCTMVHAATLGLPRTLADVGRVLKLPEDKQKMAEGKALIEYFCKPCKPTRKNGGRTRNLPQSDFVRWPTFIEYNRRDVETEREIRWILDQYPVPDEEWAAYWLDQHINDNGVLIDQDLMRSAIRITREAQSSLSKECQKLTGLDNVNSVSQLKGWLNVEGSLDKKTIKAMREGDLDETTDRVLAIRQELGKTSVTKYEAMERGICKDGRVRGLFQFYGANRTGRWAGRQVQVQNLPQNHIPDLELAREIVKEGDADMVQLFFGNVPATLSELIRTAFIAPPGSTFCVADFSAIEARVVAWLADEAWRQENFKQGGDIYCASASKMFKVPVVKHGVNGHLRQKGKIAELALGYGGSVGALTAMGALEMGLQKDELQPLVDMWRESNPHIVKLWWDIDQAARDTIRNRIDRWRMDLPHGLSMMCSKQLLHIRLPSGRCIRYWQPALETDDNGRENIVYSGFNASRWERIETYGPKLFENIVQAIARDCLRDAMFAVSWCYPQIVMHVHDEMIVEVEERKAQKALDYMLTVMSQDVSWAPGLILKGDGYITPFYKKD